jgi:hypothetical protein
MNIDDFLEIESKLKCLEKSISSNVAEIVERIERVFTSDHQLLKLNAKREQLLQKLDKQLEQNIQDVRKFSARLDLYHFKWPSVSLVKIEFLYLKSSLSYRHDVFSFYKKLAYSHLYSSMRAVSLHYDFQFGEKYRNYLLANDRCLVLDSQSRELRLVNCRSQFCLKKISLRADVYRSQAILFARNVGLVMHRETPDHAVHIHFYLFDYDLNFVSKKNLTRFLPSLYKYDLAYKHTESDDLVLEFNYIDYFRTKSGLECQAANKYYIVDLEYNVKHSFTMKVERHVNRKFSSLLSSDRRVRCVEGNTLDVLANDNSLVKKIYASNEILQMFLDARSNIYLISHRADCYVIACFDSNGALLFEKRLKNICDSFEMYDEKLFFIKNRKPIAVL